jgi:hypothetical protein
MSFKIDYDSWPWNGHKEQAREDAKFSHKNRDLYDHYDGEHKRAYAEEFDRETRKIEERKRYEEEQRYYEEQEREQEREQEEKDNE